MLSPVRIHSDFAVLFRRAPPSPLELLLLPLTVSHSGLAPNRAVSCSCAHTKPTLSRSLSLNQRSTTPMAASPTRSASAAASSRRRSAPPAAKQRKPSALAQLAKWILLALVTNVALSRALTQSWTWGYDGKWIKPRTVSPTLQEVAFQSRLYAMGPRTASGKAGRSVIIPLSGSNRPLRRGCRDAVFLPTHRRSVLTSLESNFPVPRVCPPIRSGRALRSPARAARRNPSRPLPTLLGV